MTKKALLNISLGFALLATPALAFTPQDASMPKTDKMDGKMADGKMAGDKMADDKMAGDKMAGDKMAGHKMKKGKTKKDSKMDDKMDKTVPK
jgi:hypothetical protein